MSSEFTLGAYLRRCRERFRLSVEAVSAGSRIVPGLVRALEADRHDVLPAPVHALPALGERGQVVRDATIPAEGRP